MNIRVETPPEQEIALWSSEQTIAAQAALRLIRPDSPLLPELEAAIEEAISNSHNNAGPLIKLEGEQAVQVIDALEEVAEAEIQNSPHQRTAQHILQLHRRKELKNDANRKGPIPAKDPALLAYGNVEAPTQIRQTPQGQEIRFGSPADVITAFHAVYEGTQGQHQLVAPGGLGREANLNYQISGLANPEKWDNNVVLARTYDGEDAEAIIEALSRSAEQPNPQAEEVIAQSRRVIEQLRGKKLSYTKRQILEIAEGRINDQNSHLGKAAYDLLEGAEYTDLRDTEAPYLGQVALAA